MPGPVWNDDDPRDTPRIASHVGALVAKFVADAATRQPPTLNLVCSWHERLYDSCHVRSAQYRGGLRGDASRPDRVGYEVGVGPQQTDGLPERVRLCSADVGAAVQTLLDEVDTALPFWTPGFPSAPSTS